MATLDLGDVGFAATDEGGFLIRVNGHVSSDQAEDLAEWLTSWAAGNPIADAMKGGGYSGTADSMGEWVPKRCRGCANGWEDTPHWHMQEVPEPRSTPGSTGDTTPTVSGAPGGAQRLAALERVVEQVRAQVDAATAEICDDRRCGHPSCDYTEPLLDDLAEILASLDAPAPDETYRPCAGCDSVTDSCRAVHCGAVSQAPAPAEADERPCCNYVENPDGTATACDGTTRLPAGSPTYLCDKCGGRCGSLVHPACRPAAPAVPAEAGERCDDPLCDSQPHRHYGDRVEYDATAAPAVPAEAGEGARRMHRMGLRLAAAAVSPVPAEPDTEALRLKPQQRDTLIRLVEIALKSGHNLGPELRAAAFKLLAVLREQGVTR